jgi:hypothetical protein
MTAVDQLGLFVHRADELGHTRLVRTSGLSGDFSFHFDQKTFAYKFPLVDEDHLRSFLLTFRQFVMQKEPVFIRRFAWPSTSQAMVRQALSKPQAMGHHLKSRLQPEHQVTQSLPVCASLD